MNDADDPLEPLRSARSSGELKTAFRRFARTHHPDRGGDAQLFERGVAAYRAGLGGASREEREAGDANVVGHRAPGMRREIRRWLARRRHRTMRGNARDARNRERTL